MGPSVSERDVSGIVFYPKRVQNVGRDLPPKGRREAINPREVQIARLARLSRCAGDFGTVANGAAQLAAQAAEHLTVPRLHFA
jgi:hypothetical protein